MFKNKKTTIASGVIVSSLLLSGCGLLGAGPKQKIDPPKEETYTNETSLNTKQTSKKQAEGNQQQAEKSLKTELYLIDKHGYVVPQTIDLPATNSVAKQALEHLVQNGPVQEILPNGFKAVIPADTKISVDVKDKVAVVDFSKEFKNYKAEDEQKIMQAITWTLTQFDAIEKVKLQVNGYALKEMPVNKTPLGEYLTRVQGINLDTTDVLDINNTRPVTVYYLSGEEGAYYYVPVTRRVSNKEQNDLTAAINELIKGPSYSSNLITDFSHEARLLEDPKVENGKVTLNFNESIVGSVKEKKLTQHMLDALVLSLTEQQGIESVALTVNGKTDLFNEKGEKLTEPVTRPENVNTGSF